APSDEAKEVFKLPAYIQKMVDNKWVGEKYDQRFYKKVKDKDGKTEILALNLKTLEYAKQDKVKSATLGEAKAVDDLRQRMKVFDKGNDRAAELFRAANYPLFEYVSMRIPEISDELYRIDDAMRAGFGWELGPFEIWDALGVKETIDKIEKAEISLPGQQGKVASWVYEMLEGGNDSFYKIEDGIKKFYDITSKGYQVIPGSEDFIVLDNLREKHTLWKNNSVSIIDLGDGILNAEIHSKMNTIGGDVIQGINKAIDLAEKEYRGL